MLLEPVTFALKLAFVAVLFLFVAWVARSALRDLRDDGLMAAAPPPPDATGFHSAMGTGVHEVAPPAAPRLIIRRMEGQRAGMQYDLPARTTLGRGDVEIAFEDPYASSRHARIEVRGGSAVLEDLGSTNGTYLNGERLEGPQALRSGDEIAIGDTLFEFRDR